MVEIIVRQFLEKPFVVRMPGQLPQIHIGADMQMDQIKRDLADQISTAEFKKFKQLWSDDQHPRVFVKGENYLKITDKK